MSNVVSALRGKENVHGFAAVRDLGLQGMITLRADLGAPEVKKALKSVCGLDMPAQRQCVTKADMTGAWMSPDELMIVLPYAQAPDVTAQLTEALKSEHALAVCVSDARAMLEVEGAGAREVIAKLAPVDMSSAAFTRGMIRRTRLAQAAAAFWMTGEDRFTVVCFRSEAGYVFDLLAMSASAGSEVGIL